MLAVANAQWGGRGGVFFVFIHHGGTLTSTNLSQISLQPHEEKPQMRL